MLVGMNTAAFESDDGATWTSRVLDPGTAGTADWYGVAYVHSDNAVDANGSFVVVGAYAGDAEIYTTGDGGNTWTSRLTVAAGVAFRAVGATPNGDEVVAIGENGLSYTSTDGGATWSADTGLGGSVDYQQIAYDTDRETWFARGATSLARKAKGATTWTDLSIVSKIGTDTAGGGVACSGSLMIVTNVTGDSAWYSTDGGLTFTEIPSDMIANKGLCFEANGALYYGSVATSDSYVRTLYT
jgi:photosystem II stability/assembly factor-like uncharacterized protein